MFLDRPYGGHDDQINLFFLHIPKTAGLSLREYFKSKYYSHRIFDGYTNASLAGAPFENYKLFAGHFWYGWSDIIALTKPLVRFTVLRDPIERTLSHFEYIKKHKFWIQKPDLAVDDSFTIEDFLKDERWISTSHNAQCGLLGSSIKPERLTAEEIKNLEYISTAPESLDLAKENLAKMEFTLYEKLPEFIASLNPTGEYKINDFGFKENRSYPDSVMEKVRDANKLDLELYEYAKSL